MCPGVQGKQGGDDENSDDEAPPVRPFPSLALMEERNALRFQVHHHVSCVSRYEALQPSLLLALSSLDNPLQQSLRTVAICSACALHNPQRQLGTVCSSFSPTFLQDGTPGAAQFIVTTFHPQIVEVADTAYGVQHSNCVSTIVRLAQSAALTFVRNDKSHAARGGAGGGGAAAGSGGSAAAPARRPSKRQKENNSSEENRAAAVGAVGA